MGLLHRLNGIYLYNKKCNACIKKQSFNAINSLNKLEYNF